MGQLLFLGKLNLCDLEPWKQVLNASLPFLLDQIICSPSQPFNFLSSRLPHCRTFLTHKFFSL